MNPRQQWKLNHNELAARLQAIPASPELSIGSPVQAMTDVSSSPGLAEVIEADLRDERDSFHFLLDATGHPPIPLDLVDDVFWQAQKYVEHAQFGDIVSFHWAPENRPGDTNPCAGQARRWRMFSKIARIIRDYKVESESALMRLATSPPEVKSTGPWGFHDYVRNIRKRLADHNFKYCFEPSRNFERQDKLTTWIEYLGYECRSHDVVTQQLRGLRHAQPWEISSQQRMISRYDGLLRWINQQIPTIRSEMFSCDRTETPSQPDADPVIKTKKRKRARSDDAGQDQDSQESRATESKPADMLSGGRRFKRRRRSCNNLSETKPPIRRSAPKSCARTRHTTDDVLRPTGMPQRALATGSRRSTSKGQQGSGDVSEKPTTPLRRSARLAERNAKELAPTKKQVNSARGLLQHLKGNLRPTTVLREGAR